MRAAASRATALLAAALPVVAAGNMTSPSCDAATCGVETHHAPQAGETPPGDGAEAPSRMRIAELTAILRERGVEYTDCVERACLVSRVLESADILPVVAAGNMMSPSCDAATGAKACGVETHQAPQVGETPPGDGAEAPSRMRTAELTAILRERGVEYTDCVERACLVSRVLESADIEHPMPSSPACEGGRAGAKRRVKVKKNGRQQQKKNQQRGQQGQQKKNQRRGQQGQQKNQHLGEWDEQLISPGKMGMIGVLLIPPLVAVCVFIARHNNRLGNEWWNAYITMRLWARGYVRDDVLPPCRLDALTAAVHAAHAVQLVAEAGPRRRTQMVLMWAVMIRHRGESLRQLPMDLARTVAEYVPFPAPTLRFDFEEGPVVLPEYCLTRARVARVLDQQWMTRC